MPENRDDGTHSDEMSVDRPRSEPATTIEDNADVALFAERIADLAAGRDERLSPELSKTVLDGGSMPGEQG